MTQNPFLIVLGAVIAAIAIGAGFGVLDSATAAGPACSASQVRVDAAQNPRFQINDGAEITVRGRIRGNCAIPFAVTIKAPSSATLDSFTTQITGDVTEPFIPADPEDSDSTETPLPACVANGNDIVCNLNAINGGRVLVTAKYTQQPHTDGIAPAKICLNNTPLAKCPKAQSTLP